MFLFKIIYFFCLNLIIQIPVLAFAFFGSLSHNTNSEKGVLFLFFTTVYSLFLCLYVALLRAKKITWKQADILQKLAFLLSILPAIIVCFFTFLCSIL